MADNKLQEGALPVQAGLDRPSLPAWRLEEAKAKFSEVVRRARTEGPQRVTYRGKDAVIVMAVEDYEQLAQQAPAVQPGQSLVEFLQGLGGLQELDLDRERDTGRDIEF